jgi:dihydrofolate reductase
MISIIVAYAHGRVIGREGRIPWHLPDDLQHFKHITTGHTVVMGRKTYESIRHPLSERRNIVLTHNDEPAGAGIEVVHSKEDVLALGDVFIIGGASLYRQFLQFAGRLYITEIELDVEGDAFFPKWRPDDFTLISSREGVLNKKNTIPHTFLLYERKKI